MDSCSHLPANSHVWQKILGGGYPNSTLQGMWLSKIMLLCTDVWKFMKEWAQDSVKLSDRTIVLARM
jgi:hypothetical protein